MTVRSKHAQAADHLMSGFADDLEPAISNLDLIFRWSVLRLVESNTTSLLKTLEMLSALLEGLKEMGYRLTEVEAMLLFPSLLEKSGHNIVQVGCVEFLGSNCLGSVCQKTNGPHTAPKLPAVAAIYLLGIHPPGTTVCSLYLDDRHACSIQIESTGVSSHSWIVVKWRPVVKHLSPLFIVTCAIYNNLPVNRCARPTGFACGQCKLSPVVAVRLYRRRYETPSRYGSGRAGCQTQVREKYRQLVWQSCGVYPVSKLIQTFITESFNSKNNRTRTESIESMQVCAHLRTIKVDLALWTLVEWGTSICQEPRAFCGYVWNRLARRHVGGVGRDQRIWLIIAMVASIARVSGIMYMVDKSLFVVVLLK